jgi:cytochrome c553
VLTAAQAVFVGSAACAECHPTEYKVQRNSRHAQTLCAMSRRMLDRSAPPAGPIPGTGFEIKPAGDRFFIASPAQPNIAVPLDFAFGSGKTGMTYVFVVGGDRLVELRSSYFPHAKKWYVTPGQERLEAQDVGGNFPNQAARACFQCHAVTLPDTTITPEPRFFGVGCEACHGPGSAHIAAMRAGNHVNTNDVNTTDVNTNDVNTNDVNTGANQMEPPANAPASRLNAMCGKCHGTEQEVQEQHLAPEMTNRLQAVGLMRSQCFKRSKETLSCITCHDPHMNVSTNAQTYEAICLHCHSASPSTKRPPELRTATLKSCPVNPTAGCIGCHMPRRPAIASAKVPTFMSDHFIRVFARK